MSTGVGSPVDITTVGVDVVVLHATDAEGVVHVGRFDGLTPATDHTLPHPVTGETVVVRTLAHPGGDLRSRFGTVNDVHFGETEAGVVAGARDTIGPILSVGPGDEPYPEVMNRGAAAEMRAANLDAVIVKGDLTADGTRPQYDAFLAVYQATFGAKLTHVRGNHDAYRSNDDPDFVPYADDAVQVVDLPGVRAVVLDTVIPGASTGGLRDHQLAELDDLATDAGDTPVLVFGHHHAWDPGSNERPDSYFGIHPDWSDRLVAVVARHANIRGYFAGHTHRNRVRRFAVTGGRPWVEVACVKDFPGSWAEYQVFDGGIVQLHHRISTTAALAWSEPARGMYLGQYGAYAFGAVEDRNFVI